MNIRKIVNIEAKEGKAEAMCAALLTLEAETRREEGCVSFRFYQALAAAHSFLLIEDFKDGRALEIHMGLPHTRAFFALDLAAEIKAVEPAWLS